MLVDRILRALGRNGRSLPAALRELHSAEELRTILEREKTRADRSNMAFSLVAFTPREASTAQETLVCLAKILKRRLRCTDETGWLNERQIGAVLPATLPQGAWKLAHDVCVGFGKLEPPHCEVYSYPLDSQDPGEECLNGSHAETESERPVAALEPMFVQPLAMWKRCLDVVGASVALVLFSPALVPVALAVKLTSPGPVFFRQLRAGLGGKAFPMYKFRTMRTGADLLKAQLMDQNEVDGPAFKIKNDPRITAVGRFLRRTSIDEVPQLWNVLKGDMSLVGPRPLPCDESIACSPWQKQRLHVMPGLTCICQVKGRSKISFDEWMRMDRDYVDNVSLTKDLKILLATVPAVMFGKGAY